jgi:hypothetical protein
MDRKHPLYHLTFFSRPGLFGRTNGSLSILPLVVSSFHREMHTPGRHGVFLRKMRRRGCPSSCSVTVVTDGASLLLHVVSRCEDLRQGWSSRDKHHSRPSCRVYSIPRPPIPHPHWSSRVAASTIGRHPFLHVTAGPVPRLPVECSPVQVVIVVHVRRLRHHCRSIGTARNRESVVVGVVLVVLAFGLDLKSVT